MGRIDAKQLLGRTQDIAMAHVADGWAFEGVGALKTLEASMQEAIEESMGGCWWEHTGLDPFQLMFLEGYGADEAIDLIAADINARVPA